MGGFPAIIILATSARTPRPVPSCPKTRRCSSPVAPTNSKNVFDTFSGMFVHAATSFNDPKPCKTFAEGLPHAIMPASHASKRLTSCLHQVAQPEKLNAPESASWRPCNTRETERHRTRHLLTITRQHTSETKPTMCQSCGPSNDTNCEQPEKHVRTNDTQRHQPNATSQMRNTRDKFPERKANTREPRTHGDPQHVSKPRDEPNMCEPRTHVESQRVSKPRERSHAVNNLHTEIRDKCPN